MAGVAERGAAAAGDHARRAVAGRHRHRRAALAPAAARSVPLAFAALCALVVLRCRSLLASKCFDVGADLPDGWGMSFGPGTQQSFFFVSMFLPPDERIFRADGEPNYFDVFTQHQQSTVTNALCFVVVAVVQSCVCVCVCVCGVATVADGSFAWLAKND